MSSFTLPTKAEIDSCLLNFYFGFERPFLERVIDRAYLDLHRTLHGFAKHPGRVSLRGAAGECVRRAMTQLDAACQSQRAFDQWHQHACKQLVTLYGRSGFAAFAVGQAQKWINMTVKYLALFDADQPRRQRRLLELGHMPIDARIFARLSAEGLPRTLRQTSWSRIKEYGDYMRIQTWVREHFAGSSPLVVEFHLWLLPTSTAT